MLNIVALDAYPANPGDLNWSSLMALGRCHIHDRTSPQELTGRIANAAIVLTNKAQINRTAIESSPNLKLIGVLGTGFNCVDTAAARERGITVCNVPGYSTQSVAQSAFALLLALTNGTEAHAQSVRAGDWSRCKDFSYTLSPQTELAGLTLGIIGYGSIGRATAAIARAFGMAVIAHNRSPITDGTPQVGLDELFNRGDVISLHCPLTPQTQHMVNAARLKQIKPTALLINTSRGGLIEDQALADALNSGRLAGAGLDVLAVEPPSADNPLLRAKNCVITPHIAWATTAARQRLLNATIENVRSFLNGTPRNVVSY
jgi:glycerate dehydrogenase